MPPKPFKIVIAAGGTGGHLIPAQQLAEELVQKKMQVAFAAKGLSQNFNFQKQFAFVDIQSGPVKKPFLLLKGFFQAVRFLKKYRPSVVVGFGSYHSFPVLLAAAFLKKKIVIFESNAILGRVNRFFASGADLLALQFPLVGKKQYKNSRLTRPLPWGKKIFQLLEKKDALKKLGLDPEMPALLVFGGSQGASFFVDLLLQMVSQGGEKKKFPFQLIYLTGKNEKDQAKVKMIADILQKQQIKTYIQQYSTDMGLLFSAADLALCRSGAATVAEIVFSEKPALLIPFPFAKDNHQELNALFFQNEIGGGEMLRQKAAEPAFTLQKLIFFFQQKASFQQNFKKYKAQVQTEKRKDLSDLIEEMALAADEKEKNKSFLVF